MSDDVERQVAEYGRQVFGGVPPVSVEEAQAHPAARGRVAGFRVVLAAAVVAVVAAVGLVSVWSQVRSESTSPVLTDDSTPSDGSAGSSSGYPSMLVVEGNRPTARLLDPFTGNVLSEIAPEGIGSGGLTGAGATGDGRAVLWVGPNVVVRDGGVDHLIVVPVAEAPTGALPELDVALTSRGTFLWAVQPSTADGAPRAWLIDYESDDLVAEPDLSDTSNVSIAGVTDRGFLVISIQDETAFRVLDLDGSALHPDTTGEAVAVHPTGVLYQECNATSTECRLLNLEATTGESAEITADLTPPAGSYVSMSNPEILGSYMPIPSHDRSGSRVVIGAAEYPNTPQDNPTRAVVVDLDTNTVNERSTQFPGEVSLPFWSCDDSGLAVVSDNQIVSDDGQRTGVELGPNEFLVGIGSCAHTSTTVPSTGEAGTSVSTQGVAIVRPSGWFADTTGQLYLDQVPPTGLAAITVASETFDVEPDRDCGQIPSAAIRSVGAAGAMISVLEVPRERGSNASLALDRSDLLPTAADVIDLGSQGCDFAPTPVTITEFEMSARYFQILVALGPDAPETVAQQTLDVLDSLEVE